MVKGLPFYPCDICGMYFEAVFRFCVLFNHFVSNPIFRLVCFSSLGDIIKRHFALAKLDFYVDYAVGLLWESSTTVSTVLPFSHKSRLTS